MRTLLVVVSLASLPLVVAGCCGYGGPGCADPGIEGLCGDQLSGEQRVTLNYFDDTGAHPSDFGAVSASPAKHLTARRGDELGEIVLVGRSPGPARLTISDIPGWSQTFDWELRVVSDVDPVACESPEGRFLRPLPTLED